ncbi:MAG: hypothetical protein KC420_18220, partial [Myxococcales bacterium]|nr:hypothetical protein [Myxococcales bacterium]
MSFIHRRQGPLPLFGAGALLVALAGIPLEAAAAPVVVFDSFSGGSSATNRGAGSSPGSMITVSNNNHTLAQVAVLVDLNSGGNLKFVVFDHANHQLLYVSPPKFFADDGKTWKVSNTFSLNLVAGKTYDIGAISDVGGSWAFDSTATVMGDFKSTVQNPNFSNYASPSAGGHAVAYGAVRCYDDTSKCGDGKV